jgi:hypothetical protein
MISRSPIQTVQEIPYPKLEKILVDIVADEDKFYIFHGRELVNIYEGAFNNYRMSQRTLFWYAQRRRVKMGIRDLITNNTGIRIVQE